MALSDHYEEAEVLYSFSWISMTNEARIARLANLYLDNEDDMESNHARYEGPTLGCVRFFVKSCYSPPRGLGEASCIMRCSTSQNSPALDVMLSSISRSETETSPPPIGACQRYSISMTIVV